jgi:hypothetical protein
VQPRFLQKQQNTLMHLELLAQCNACRPATTLASCALVDRITAWHVPTVKVKINYSEKNKRIQL